MDDKKKEEEIKPTCAGPVVFIQRVATRTCAVIRPYTVDTTLFTVNVDGTFVFICVVFKVKTSKKIYPHDMKGNVYKRIDKKINVKAQNRKKTDCIKGK